MKRNLSRFESILRVLIAASILLLWKFEIVDGVLFTVLAVFGGLFLMSGIFSYCPVYALFGWRTCKAEDQNN